MARKGEERAGDAANEERRGAATLISHGRKRETTERELWRERGNVREREKSVCEKESGFF